jgi:hypothetical protein
MLLSLQSYLAHPGSLYTGTFTQYGPFFFISQEFWFRLLHLPVTHDAGRLVTLGYWLLSALLAAGAMYRLFPNLLLASATFALCTVQAQVLAREPGHPQQLILVLFASALFALGCNRDRTTRWTFFLLGGIGAALFLTKINVGLFFLLGVAHAIACGSVPGLVRRLSPLVTIAISVCLPYLLMRGISHVASYRIAATLLITVTLTCSAMMKAEFELPWQASAYAVMGIASVGTIIVATAWIRGISLYALARGVVLEPARHPRVFLAPLHIVPLTLLVGAGLLVIAGALTIHASRKRSESFEMSVSALRCIAGVIAIPYILAGRPELALAIVPLSLIKLPGQQMPPSMWLFRVVLADIAALQFLQIFPVAGSQLWIAGWPMLFCAMLCMAEGASGLTLVAGGRWRLASMVSAPLLFVGIATFVLIQSRPTGILALRHSRPSSGLRGASLLSLNPYLADQYRYLSERIRSNCDVLFTMPGMGSFNLWSGVAPPNGTNLTAWVEGLDRSRQAEILQILTAHPNACVIYNPELLEFWHTSRRAVKDSALAQHILHSMLKADEREGYEIRIQPWRTRAWTD